MSALEIVQNYYTFFNNKNWKGMLALVDDAIVHEPNQGEARVGIELFTAFLELMDSHYDETLTDMTFFTEPSGTKIACQFTVNGIYKQGEEGFPEAHGQSYVLPACAFLEVNNGKITRVSTHYNLPLWIKLVS